MARNVRSDLVVFLRYRRGRAPRRLRWFPGRRSDDTPATVLELEDEVPRPPFRRGAPLRLAITSRHHRLRSSRFGAVAAGAINAVGAKGHRRTLTCLDRTTREPLAALSFHLDEDTDAPLLVLAIAVLTPGLSAPEAALSRAAAGILLCDLAAAAQARGLPPTLGFAPPLGERDLALQLGFRKTAAPASYAAAGARYMTWSRP